MSKTILFAPLAIVLALAAGCEDPAKGKVKAAAGEAQPAAAGVTPTASSKTYAFDASSGSKIEWIGSKVTGKHEGGFRDFKGKVEVDPAAPEKGRVEVEIDTTSLYTDSDRLVGHLKTADFFDVANHPKAKFVSTDVKRNGDTWKVTGNLTLRGTTKSISFPAKVKLGDGVDVDAEFAIDRKDFGMRYEGKADDLIRDDVVVKLAIRSRLAS